MRLIPLSIGLAVTAGVFFGQQAGAPLGKPVPDRPSGSLPYRIPVPGLTAPAADRPALQAAQSGAPRAYSWPLPDWKKWLIPDGAGRSHQMFSETRQCAIPLIPVPIPKHFDDKMVLPLGRNDGGPAGDRKMAWTPIPVCPLHGNWASTAHMPNDDGRAQPAPDGK